MIAVETNTGEFIKVLKEVNFGEFGFHNQFGFISKKRAEERIISRKRQGYDFTNNDWHCLFKLSNKNNQFSIDNTENCDAMKTKDGWLLNTPLGNFRFAETSTGQFGALETDKEEPKSSKLDILGIALLFLIPLIYFFYNNEKVEELEEEKVVEPITVKIIKPAQTVKIQRHVNRNLKVKPLTKAEISKRAVKRNLGFLGMVGSKDLKKVTGGIPQELKKASAGAGKGGDAGSGGEVLTGVGKGLRKTTVGNTGVQGLGGIGTKGAGGGKGGYGNTLVASGNGKGISAIAVSSSDVVLQGGISRYAINATIAKYLNQVRRCYEAQLKTKPSIQGLVEMSFEINASGMLNFARVNRTTLKDKPTENCISKKMMTWEFPKPKGGVKVPVKYPFMLRPVGS